MKKVMSMLITILTLFTLAGCVNTESSTSPVKVKFSETVHSVFYAPHYVALEKGFFEDEGLELTISVAQGSDKCMTALISNNVDVALLGPETGIFIYTQGKAKSKKFSNYPITFAQCTRRAGNFLVSRTNDIDFQWTDVIGKTIIGGRKFGMPQMTLEYVLKKYGITPYVDVEINTSIDFPATAGAFIGGAGDYTVEFEPSATGIENEGRGYVIASMGAEAQVPYTVYMSTPKYIKKNPAVIQKFTNAVYRGQQWVLNNSAQAVAEAIQPQFSNFSITDLTKIVERYKAVETWNTDPVLTEEDFELLQDIMMDGKAMEERVPYSEIVNNDFAYKAIKNVNN